MNYDVLLVLADASGVLAAALGLCALSLLLLTAFDFKARRSLWLGLFIFATGTGLGVLAASLAPADLNLQASARAALHSQVSAAHTINTLRRRGVDDAGVRYAFQLPATSEIVSESSTRRARVLGAFNASDNAPEVTPPSRAQQCELLRLLLGVDSAEPNGQCLIGSGDDALAGIDAAMSAG